VLRTLQRRPKPARAASSALAASSSAAEAQQPAKPVVPQRPPSPTLFGFWRYGDIRRHLTKLFRDNQAQAVNQELSEHIARFCLALIRERNLELATRIVMLLERYPLPLVAVVTDLLSLVRNLLVSR